MAYNIKGDLGVLRRIFSRFIRVESLSGNTGNVLAADNNGEIVSRNVDFFLTGSTIFNNKVNNSTFYPYTSTTNTLIGTKLNISDFSSYSANTQNTINNNYSQFTGFTNNFYDYTSATNTLIGTKLDTAIFANYTANTGSNVSAEFTAFTQTFYQYTADTNNLINTKLDKTTFTAFTNSFYSYSSNTLNTINNNYSQFTGFTNSFYSYSSNTQNTINNNYSQFTGFTNSFNSYSANTQNQLNNKYDKSGGTISGNVTINGNLIVNGTATTINTQNLLVYDPIIGLALVQSGSTNPTLDSGFIIERGLSGNTGFIWKESNKQFELGYTNNTYNDINVNISQFGDLKVGGLKTNYIYDSLSSTGLTNYILTTTPTGIKWLSGTTTVDISGKLDVSVFTAFTNSFYSYSSNTQNTINSNYSQFTAFTNSFNSYSANTRNTINNNYSQFTSFTNSFYSYSSNTQNTINSNYRQFTAFTNTFYVYSAQTDSRLLFSSGTVGSTFRVNNNNEASGQYSTVSGGIGNKALGNCSFVGGGIYNTSSGNNTFILGSNITGTLDNTTYVENLNVKNNIYDSFGTTGTTGYLLSTTPTGVKWVSGATSTSLTPNFDYIDFTTGYTTTAKTGRVYYDSNEQALSYFPNTPSMDVTVNIGQESLVRVYNSTGAQINNGSVVHISGSTGGLPTIVLSNASDDARAEVTGVATHDIPNNSIGFITYFGIVRDVNTSAFNVGDELYLSDTINGGFTNNVIGINFSSRVCSVGWVITSGTTNGKILVSITNENKVQSLTNKQVNILLGNTISTGVFEFTGLTKTSNTTFQIAPVKAWFVDNTSNPIVPQVLQINYSGSTTGQTTPYLTTNDSTFVLMTSAGTISYQTSFPSPQERRQNIFLGKVVHPSRTSILNVNNTVDFDVSPMSALRDLWTPIKSVNQGIIVSPNGANLNINTSAGVLWGNGIGWTTSQLNPNSVSISAKSPATFAYRTQTGGTTGEVSLIDVANYDVNGAVTPVPGTQYTTQRVYQFPTGLIRIQYGQVSYPTLAKALAGLTTEPFVEFVNNRDNGILIGLITVASNASDLSNTSQAIFTLVSKFGEVLTGTAGGLSTTTLQQAYDNSVQPEILTDSTLGAVTFRRGSTADTDNVFEVQNNAGTNTFAVTGQGNVSGNSFNVKTYIYDSTNTSGTTNQVLFTSPSGVRWNNIDGIVTGYTSSKLNITDFSSYSANTLTNINNNYNQFTAFTNSFNSYSANTLTNINNKLDTSVFTGFTNSFYSYSSNTLNNINNKVIENGSGVLSSVRINANNIASGNYSGALSGTGNTSSAIHSFIGGGRNNTVLGNFSNIDGGCSNIVTGITSSILGGGNNTILGINSIIGGGTGNTVTSAFGNILGGRNNIVTANNSFILGSNITANSIDTTFTQCINACGQTLLQGTSASSGCVLLVRNSTPLSLYTALNTGQHLFNGTFTATANNTCGWNLNQTLTQRGTACDTLYATYINPTIIYTQHNQTNKSLSVQTLFTGTTLTWTGATNIIADFGATNIGTQLTVSDVISGTIYGVNDVSGLPIIDATSNWDVNIYDFPNTVLSKTGKTLTFGVIRNSASTVTVQSDFILNEGIGLGYRMSQVSGLTTGSSVSVLYQLAIPTGQTVFLTANTLGRANNANMDSTISEYKYTAKRSLTGSLTQVGVAQGFVNRDNNNTNVGIDISSNNIRLVVTGNTDTYLWASTIIAQTY